MSKWIIVKDSRILTNVSVPQEVNPESPAGLKVIAQVVKEYGEVQIYRQIPLQYFIRVETQPKERD